VAFLLAIAAPGAARAQVCGDGAIEPAEGCDDGNLLAGDGCAADCTVELGWFCVPSLHASGVNPAGAALAEGNADPHWVWSLSPDGSNPSPGYVGRNPAWANLPPGNWVTTDPSFGNVLNTQVNTYWFQDVFMPPIFAGNLTFPVRVAADNEAEVFVNGVSFGTVIGFGAAGTVSIPSSAFVPGTNTISIRLIEYVPSTPRGILMYPGGGGILSLCTRGCDGDGECDDSNPCTTDRCIAGACQSQALPFGTTCTSTGICTRAEPVPICVSCVDSSTVATSTAVDLGCAPARPFCDTSSVAVCVECQSDPHCSGGRLCLGGACADPLPPDAGVLPDADPPDAGLAADAPTADAAPAEAGIDATALDLGTEVPDTGARDSAGPGLDAAAPGLDAAASADGGGGEHGGGCGCSSAPAEGRGAVLGGWMVLAAAWWLRRRARLDLVAGRQVGGPPNDGNRVWSYGQGG
jgi:MYXO-CTERM domain-containing protein